MAFLEEWATVGVIGRVEYPVSLPLVQSVWRARFAQLIQRVENAISLGGIAASIRSPYPVVG